MGKIKVEGIDKLEKALKRNVTLNDVKRTVRHNGEEFQTRMRVKADFKKGYQTGTTKRSIGLAIVDEGFTAVVEPKTEYAPCLQIGRSVWQHMLKNRAKSVEILGNIA
jgi:hypothetical protein